MTTPRHPKRGEALAMLADGFSLREVALELGLRQDAVANWALVAGRENGKKAPKRKDRTLTDREVVDMIAREARGESWSDLGAELGIRGESLCTRATHLRRIATWIIEVGGLEDMGLPGIARSPSTPSLPRWVRELRPVGARVECLLADDGMGEVRLVAKITNRRGETSQESWAPTARGWDERLLMHLGGVVSNMKEPHHRPCAVPMDDEGGDE